MTKKKKRTSYNIRLIDNGDGTYSLGFIHRFRNNKNIQGGEWVDGSQNKVKRLLVKGELRD